MAKVKVVSTDDCWLWAGYTQPNGYGALYSWITKRITQAHRFMYECLVGDIPQGLEIDHLCKVRCCINPDHLEPVTKQENMARRFGHNLCKRGHELTPQNCYYGIKSRTTGRIGRQCRICCVEWQRNRHAMKKIMVKEKK